MNSGHRHISSRHLDQCGVCHGQGLEPVWQLDAYPLTEMFGPFDANFPAVDQMLMRCAECGHIQLRDQVDPEFLYAVENYQLSSGTSPKLLAEYEFLMTFLRSLTEGRKVANALEFGANNLTFARILGEIAGHVVACDPLLPETAEEPAMTLIHSSIEAALQDGLDVKPQLVVARHTLEHVANPVQVVDSLLDACTQDALLVFEVPSLEHIAAKLRYDAVTHQHIHYFSLASAQTLATVTGSRLVAWRHNPWGSNGGSLLFALERSSSRSENLPQVVPDPPEMLPQIARFKAEMDATLLVLGDDLSQTSGFGASLMLATLNYHLRGAIDSMNFVFDDAQDRSGTSYRNVDIQVRHTSEIDAFLQGTFLVTSFENGRTIFRRLSELGVGRIVSPIVS